MTAFSQNDSELLVSFMKNTVISIERNRQYTRSRKQELLEARKSVSDLATQPKANDVAVFMGDGYYVHYPPKQALETIDRMILVRSKYIVQCDKKLDSFKQVITDIEQILANDESSDNSCLLGNDVFDPLENTVKICPNEKKISRQAEPDRLRFPKPRNGAAFTTSSTLSDEELKGDIMVTCEYSSHLFPYHSYFFDFFFFFQLVLLEPIECSPIWCILWYFHTDD